MTLFAALRRRAANRRERSRDLREWQYFGRIVNAFGSEFADYYERWYVR